MPTLILTHRDVASLVGASDALAAVETAFALHGSGRTRMPPKVYLALPEHDGDFRAMPVFIDRLDVGSGAIPAAGIKWINSHPKNLARHALPAVIGVFILSDPETAYPLAILDATVLTALRTGAAAAVATKYLARPDARSLALIGCGAQARNTLRAHASLKKWDEVLLHDSRKAAAEALARDHGELPCRVVDVDEASRADVICTMTPSRGPLVFRRNVRAGAHINALGADAPGKQELEPAILHDARVFLDDLEQASESGEVNVPLHSGALMREDIAGTLGEVIAGTLAGRVAASDITVFDSTGLAVQDLALARVVYERAIARGLGQNVALVDG
jgi:ornithine cyclodeaminase/alanine dehydrogenase